MVEVKSHLKRHGQSEGEVDHVGDTEELLLHRSGPVCTLVINRPEKRNRLTPASLFRMAAMVQALAQEDKVRVLVIRGAGNEAFCAGYDISALPVKPNSEDEDGLKEAPPREEAFRAVQAFPYPVIAMLNGYAYGAGCELAVTCDIRIAADHAKMGMPPAKLGLVYPYMGYRRFMRVLGLSRTLEIFLTARHYDAQTCLRMGLVNHVVRARELESYTYAMAAEIVDNAPLSLWGTKSALYKIAEHPILEKEEEEIQSLFIQSLKSKDAEEARQAFQEKRKPRFKGK
ncbi:MAG: enoyl-CoA hydratase/isomerase family protein [Deltaproteobacteria bacterium]